MSARKNETVRAWLVVAVLLLAPAVAALADDDGGYDDSSSYAESGDQEDDSGDAGYVEVPTYRGYGYSGSYTTPPPPVMIVRPRPGMRTFGGTTWTGDGTVCFSGTAGTACY